MSIMPPASDCNNPQPDDTIVATWRDCDCEWLTKFCEDNHTRFSSVPRSVLIAASDD